MCEDKGACEWVIWWANSFPLSLSRDSEQRKWRWEREMSEMNILWWYAHPKSTFHPRDCFEFYSLLQFSKTNVVLCNNSYNCIIYNTFWLWKSWYLTSARSPGNWRFIISQPHSCQLTKNEISFVVKCQDIFMKYSYVKLALSGSQNYQPFLRPSPSLKPTG